MINEIRPMQKLTPLQNVICTIGNLPTSYALSLSYEEQIMWLCEFLDEKVLPAIETNTEITEETQQAFLELKQYVDDYFDNLDVQEEINNKLDEMVEQGTLQEIINAYLQSNCIWSFNNINEMLNASNLINGSKCKTLGYYEKNDGGSGLYVIRNRTFDDVIDNGKIHLISENLVAELIFDNDFITPEQFGAVGDGETNDTTAIKNCFNCKLPVILTKNYLIDETINIYNNINGNGKLITNANYVELSFNNVSNISIKNINIDFNSFPTLGIVIENCKNIIIENVDIQNIGNLTADYSSVGIFVKSSSKNIKISNCIFKKAYGLHMASFIYIKNAIENEKSSNILIDNCYFEDCQPIEDADAVKVLGGNWNCYLTVSNCTFINCLKRAMKFQGRECHSLNNYIYYSKPTMYPIDFQRGFGSSNNDTIMLDYDGETVLDSAGMSYAGISIAQGHVNIDNLTIKRNTEELPSNISSSGAIYFNSLPEYDDGNIKDVSITNCNIDGFAYLMRFNENINEINLSNLFMENITFKALKDTDYALRIQDIAVINSIFKFIKLVNTVRLIVGGDNFSNNIIETNIDSSRLYTNENVINNNTLINHSNQFYASNFIKEKSKMKVYATNNANPSESTSSQWSNLRLAPKGTIVLCKDWINNNDNTYTIGYISTTAGSASACGTFIPIKINV